MVSKWTLEAYSFDPVSVDIFMQLFNPPTVTNLYRLVSAAALVSQSVAGADSDLVTWLCSRLLNPFFRRRSTQEKGNVGNNVTVTFGTG